MYVFLRINFKVVFQPPTRVWQPPMMGFLKSLMPRYDPSTDGHHCGWSGPDHSDGESRCGAAGDSGTYRPLAGEALIHRENGGASWYGTLNDQPHYYTLYCI